MIKLIVVSLALLGLATVAHADTAELESPSFWQRTVICSIRHRIPQLNLSALKPFKLGLSPAVRSPVRPRQR